MDKEYYLWYDKTLGIVDAMKIDHKQLRGQPLWDLWKEGYHPEEAVKIMFPKNFSKENIQN